MLIFVGNTLEIICFCQRQTLVLIVSIRTRRLQNSPSIKYVREIEREQLSKQSIMNRVSFLNTVKQTDLVAANGPSL